MADVVATWTGPAEARMQGAAGATRGIPGYGTFATADGGYVALGVLDENHFWAALCTAVGLDAHAGLDFAARVARTRELQQDLAAAVASSPRDELVDRLLAAGVPVAPVLDRAGMLAVEHFRARGVNR
jgi:crotonobetainyl-CoA:carnitine CoA-transferase CaiB-like acyl-CoA transferase